MADRARVLNNEEPLFQLKDFEMEISFVVRLCTSAPQLVQYPCYRRKSKVEINSTGK